ncbi:glutathione S-transferase family protein [Jiella sp. M17.18]|uniref:glutathione S-transferase family protein n=1 Tax=Jiella sp. M17.18 TaxID=3234247 RepID=UPI0034DF751D
MVTIYGMSDSGNCYKPRLLIALLGRRFRHVEVSTIDGGTRQPGFLAKTPNGKVPLLELDDGRTLPESNAILAFLGEGSRFVPEDAFTRAEMLGWMFFEQYSHEPHVAVRRSLMIYPHLKDKATPGRLAETLAGGEKAFRVMEHRLSQADWLAGDRASLADIALYAYTHLGPQGGYDLQPYPGIRAWLGRVATLPGYRPITWLPED